MIGLLANSHAFDRWQSRKASTASAHMAEVNAMITASVGSPVAGSGVENSAYGEWWTRIKSMAEGGEFKRHGTSAVIDIVGALDYKYDLWSYFYDSSCYKGIMAKVASAAADASIEQIVLYIDSPGGTHHGCPEAASAIWEARQSGKEVIAVVDPEAASAGYWMASQANRIVSIESGWVGSLGSQIMLHSMKRMYDKEGIDLEVIRAAISPNKNLGHPYEELSDEARAERQGWVDVAGEQFVEQVARGRGVKREDVLKSYGQGKMFFATQAIERGMIDEIGSLEAIVNSGVSKKKGVYSARESLAASLKNRLRSKLGPLGSKSRNGGLA